jgi:hypothetical protein
MLIKVKKNWKDLVDSGPAHKSGMTRREFMMKGLATGTMSVAVHQALVGDLIAKAFADTISCPAPVKNVGAIAQIFSEGGPTMGARFIGEAQAAAMSVGMADNYGISGQANLVRLGPNMVIDSTSPFGATLLQGPNGYAGGAAAWRANVLSKISGGAHLGPFNQDDGAGDNTGLIGGVSPFKLSTMGKDLRIGVSKTPAAWANGLPSSTLKGNLTSASLASTFSLIPAANGLTNSGALTAASNAANSLAQAMSPVFKNATRKGSSELLTNAGCAFYGNTALADPTYGSTLFTASGIQALTGKLTVGALSAAEQAQLAAFYQSAQGVAGGVIMQFNGRDYHGNNPQTDIAPKDIEEARTIVMFLAACEAAQAPGAMIYFSNGQAIANGVQSANVTIGGQNVTVNAPVAAGDAGGAYNAGLIIFYDPKGAPPVAKFTGSINSTTGNAQTDPNVASSREAVAGLYLSALAWVNGGKVPQAALTKMQTAGVAATPSKTMVI